MTTQTTTSTAPAKSSAPDFNEGLRFFLMNVRLNLGTAVEMATDEAHQGIELEERSLAIVNAVVRETIDLLDLVSERVTS